MRLQCSGLDKVVICSLSFLFQMSSMTTSKYKVASGGISPATGAAARAGRELGEGKARVDALLHANAEL